MGPPYLCRYFELHGAPVCVLDLSVRLGRKTSVSFVDRKIVVARSGEQTLALCVDDVLDPRVYGLGELRLRAAIGGAGLEPLDVALYGFAPTATGSVPIVNVEAFFSTEPLGALTDALRAGEVGDA
jgi:chemotaxis signal transduction protein